MEDELNQENSKQSQGRGHVCQAQAEMACEHFKSCARSSFVYNLLDDFFPFANAGNIAENMSSIGRLALNLLQQEKTAKCGIAIRRQMAGWDDD